MVAYWWWWGEGLHLSPPSVKWALCLKVYPKTIPSAYLPSSQIFVPIFSPNSRSIQDRFCRLLYFFLLTQDYGQSFESGPASERTQKSPCHKLHVGLFLIHLIIWFAIDWFWQRWLMHWRTDWRSLSALGNCWQSGRKARPRCVFCLPHCFKFVFFLIFICGYFVAKNVTYDVQFLPR